MISYSVSRWPALSKIAWGALPSAQPTRIAYRGSSCTAQKHNCRSMLLLHFNVCVHACWVRVCVRVWVKLVNAKICVRTCIFFLGVVCSCVYIFYFCSIFLLIYVCAIASGATKKPGGATCQACQWFLRLCNRFQIYCWYDISFIFFLYTRICDLYMRK